MGDNL